MREKLRVLFIHHGQGIGGASMSLLYLVQGLPKEKYDPVVLFLQNSDALPMFRQAGINCVGPLNLSDFSHTVIWWYKWYNAKSFAKAIFDNLRVYLGLGNKILLQINPDIVHLNTSSLFVWAICARALGFKVVSHVREPLAKGYLGLRKRLVTWALAKYCDAIVPISKNESLPWSGNSKITVIYNAVPESFYGRQFDAEVSNNQPKTILFLGGMSEQKGTLLLLEAFKLLVEQGINATLLIAGAFNYEQNWLKNTLKITSFSRYSSKVARLVNFLGPRVEIKGVCTNVPELIRSATLVVFPATVGHFARPIIEAGFLKKPVVTTYLPPLEELVIDGITGLLVAPECQSLARAVALIVQNPVLANNLGINNYNFCKKTFCLTEQINRITVVYNSLFNSPCKPMVCRRKNV